jgi:ABC-2 type transport system ATP-binding protein
MSAIIHVHDLKKYFQVPRQFRGRMGWLRTLLTRQYRTIKAVDGISFDIRKGELVGYLGPNGAGKSTTVKMLAGLLVPTAGELEVNGRVPWRERQAYVAQIGAVFGQRTTLWWDLPLIESLDLLQYIYKIPENIFHRNLLEFRNLLDLDPFLSLPVRSLSLGQRMRADLCAALLHNPPLVFLDEPTIGLDVVAKERIRQFIKHINQERRTTVILTTHDLIDVEKLCERVMIIDNGHLLYDGSLEALKARFGGKRELVVEFAEAYEQYEVDRAEISAQEGQRVTYLFDRKLVSASDLINSLSSRFHIRDLEVREQSLEVTIRRIYEGRLLEKEFPSEQIRSRIGERSHE